MFPIAKEGLREIGLATLMLGGLGAVTVLIAPWYTLAPFVIVWLWVLSFFRDPMRRRSYAPGDLCAAADGTVTEIRELDHDETIGGPALRIGVFLSLFNVHINRFPCSGRVTAVTYEPGEFLDARHPQSGQRNESNTLVIETEPPLPGPVIVRQVAGLVARRIICHARVGDPVAIGARLGLIKFGSRTEMILPRSENTEILVKLGDKVRGGLTIVARQPVHAEAPHRASKEPVSTKGAPV